MQGNQSGTTEVLALDRGDSGRGEKWLAFIYIFEIESKGLLKNWMWRGERGERERVGRGSGKGERGRERGIQKYSKPFGMPLAEMMEKP